MEFVVTVSAKHVAVRVALGGHVHLPGTGGWVDHAPGGAIDVCGRCEGAVRVIVEASNRCIEDQETIDRTLDHLRQEEQELPTQLLLVPPTRAPPGALPLFAGKGARYQNPLIHRPSSREANRLV